MAEKKEVAKIKQQYNKLASESLEFQLVGSLIKDPELLIHVDHIISQEVITHPQLRVVMSEIEANKGEQLSKEYLSSALLKRAIFKNYSEEDMLEWLTTVQEKGSTIPDHVKKAVYGLKEMKMRRSMLTLSEILKDKVFNHEDIFEINEYATKQLSDIYDIPTKQSKDNQSVFEQMEKEVLEGKKGLSTGYPSLDKVVYGLERGDLVIAGGRASMGKTAFAINIARNVAKDGKKVLYISIEMSHAQLLRRLQAIETELDINDLRDAEVYKQFHEAIKESEKEISGWNLIIDDETSKLGEFSSRIMKENLKGECDLVIVDYLQIIQHHVKARNRENEVSDISKELKRIAKHANVPVIALSQLSRASEQNEGKRPTLANLRESGSIENDADTVILLHRPDYYNRETRMNPDQTAEIIVAKGRNTGVGDALLNYKPYLTKFEEIDNLPI